ncbi:MAG TPA: nucleotide exchange factor GrpE [Terriglobales bacterium]|nr:nucleotide exchange factor GrpE [Terriglobales bacterium]
MSSQEPELPPVDAAQELAPETAAAAGAEELRRVVEERDALQDRLLRTLAEADNYRKRMQRELLEARAHATTEAVRPFLTVLDGFERAARHGHAHAGDLRKGLELLHRQLEEAARKAGLEAIAALDQRFDPHQHEAIEMVETEAVPEGTVVEELQRGYKLKDRLVRPAMVKVARGKQ